MIFSRALALCLHCIVPRCDFVFGSDLLFFVLTQTPDCYLSSGRESEKIRGDEGRRCVCVCVSVSFPCLSMHASAAWMYAVEGGWGRGVSCSHSSDSASVTGVERVMKREGM